MKSARVAGPLCLKQFCWACPQILSGIILLISDWMLPFNLPRRRKVNHRDLSDFQNFTLGCRCSYLYHKTSVRKYTKYLQKGLKWKHFISQRAPGYVMCQLTLVPTSFIQYHLNNFNSFSVLVYIPLYCVKKTHRKHHNLIIWISIMSYKTKTIWCTMVLE